MISKRIKELASLVPEKKRLIDVGCDHALLDIYLANTYKNMSFLATDISKNAIEGAIKNINENNLESRIKTMVTDGLNNISLNEDDVIVISGMGTNTIIKIISPYLGKINDVIVQANRDLELLREFMLKNGFKIKNERVIFDDRYYVFIYFEKGYFEFEETDIWLGPIIKESNNIDYFKFLLKKYQKVLSEIPDSKKKMMIKKRADYLQTLIQKK